MNEDEELIASVARGFAADFQDEKGIIRQTVEEWHALEKRQARSQHDQAINLLKAGYTIERLRAEGRPDLAAFVDHAMASPLDPPARLTMRDDAIAYRVGWVAASTGRCPTQNREPSSQPAKMSASAIVAEALKRIGIDIKASRVEGIWNKSKWRDRDAHWKHVTGGTPGRKRVRKK